MPFFRHSLVLLCLSLCGIAFSQDLPLENGTPIVGEVAAAVGGGATLSATQYFFDVPAGATEVFVSLFALNPLQDIDLEIRKDERVAINGTSIVSDYFSETVGSGSETLTITSASNPPLSSGRHYVGIVNYDPAPVSFTLIAQIESGTEETPTPTPSLTPTPSFTPSSTPSPTSTFTQTPTTTPTNSPVGTASPTPSPTETPDPTQTLLEKADFDGNQKIDARDLIIFRELWGQDWNQTR